LMTWNIHKTCGQRNMDQYCCHSLPVIWKTIFAVAQKT
jgi:hypothetical protein